MSTTEDDDTIIIENVTPVYSRLDSTNDLLEFKNTTLDPSLVPLGSNTLPTKSTDLRSESSVFESYTDCQQTTSTLNRLKQLESLNSMNFLLKSVLDLRNRLRDLTETGSITT